jgi:SOS-response transcriptional repressor LexA
MMAVPIYSSIPASRPGRTFSQARDVEFVPDYEGDLPMWGVFVFGDSMEPEFLNGDIVIFEERQALPMQAVYAEKDGEETFKLLRPTKVGFEFWPLNDAHEPFSAEGWTIRGVLRRRVRYLQGGLKNTLDYPYTYTFRLPKS